jgi:hypothetical protein
MNQMHLFERKSQVPIAEMARIITPLDVSIFITCCCRFMAQNQPPTLPHLPFSILINTMSTLCGTCSSLAIDEDIVADLRKRTQGIINDEAIAYILQKNFSLTIRGLAQSAYGIGDRQGCHLCLLLLRSLQKIEADGSPPQTKGPFDLELNVAKHGMTVTIRGEGKRGHPLQVSVGNCHSLLFPSSPIYCHTKP